MMLNAVHYGMVQETLSEASRMGCWGVANVADGPGLPKSSALSEHGRGAHSTAALSDSGVH